MLHYSMNRLPVSLFVQLQISLSALSSRQLKLQEAVLYSDYTHFSPYPHHLFPLHTLSYTKSFRGGILPSLLFTEMLSHTGTTDKPHNLFSNGSSHSTGPWVNRVHGVPGLLVATTKPGPFEPSSPHKLWLLHKEQTCSCQGEVGWGRGGVRGWG